MSKGSPQRRQTWLAIVLAVVIISAGILVFPRIVEHYFSDERDLEPLPPPRQPAPPPGATKGPSPADLSEIDRVRKMVWARQGADLAVPGGDAALHLPPHALGEDQAIELIRFAIEDDAYETQFAFDLRPDGLVLDRPASLALAMPRGYDPGELEIAHYDLATDSWVPETGRLEVQGDARLAVSLDHFSLRRIRVRPGMDFLLDDESGRGTFYLESDAGNTFEDLVAGDWSAVSRRSPRYRELMRLGRLGRMDLINTGRLRAITAARPSPSVFRDDRRTVAMPKGSPVARTGWVKLIRLDEQGEPTGHQTIARVSDYGPGPAARGAGVIADLSRATMEALGLTWGQDFGISAANPNLAWIRIPRGEGGLPLRYVPLRIESYEPQPPRAPTRRLW